MCEVLSRNTVFVSNVDFSVGAAVPGPLSGFRVSQVRVSLDAEENLLFFSDLTNSDKDHKRNATSET